MFNTSRLLSTISSNLNKGSILNNGSMLFKNVNKINGGQLMNKSFYSTGNGRNNNSNNNNNNKGGNNNKYGFNNGRFVLPGIIITTLGVVTATTTSIISCETITTEHSTKTITIPEVEYQDIHSLKRKNKVQQVAGVTTIGGVLGYCAGLATRKIGTFVLFFVGTVFIVIQILSSKGYLVVKWDKVNNEHAPKLTKEKTRKYLNSFYRMLTSNLPFKVGFGSGFVLGFRSN